MKVKKLIELLAMFADGGCVIRTHRWKDAQVGGVRIPDYETVVLLDVQDMEPSDEPVDGDVPKLLSILRDQNPNAVVRLDSWLGDPVLFVYWNAEDNSVRAEGENDADVHEFILSMYEEALEELTDELDFYGDMLDSGITPELVRKYYSANAGDAMERFCSEHAMLAEKKTFAVKKTEIYERTVIVTAESSDEAVRAAKWAAENDKFLLNVSDYSGSEISACRFDTADNSIPPEDLERYRGNCMKLEDMVHFN